MLLAVATALSLTAGELGCRIWGAMSGDQTPGAFLVNDATLGWSNRPSFDGRHSAQDFDVAVRFDAAGRRYGLRMRAPRSGRPLVLAVGDSTTFGWGVEEEQSFVGLLRDRLDADIENLAVTGYGPGQQLLSLRAALSTLKPRLVIVTHTHNDIAEAQHSYLYRKYKPRFVAEGDGLRLTNVPVPLDHLAEVSHLWRTILKQFGRFEARELTADEQQAGRDLVQRLYREMHRECASRSVKIVLVGMQADWLRNFALREAIPYLDLTAVFAQLEQTGAVRFEHDPQWLPRTHAAVALELGEFLMRERLLED